jgi:hypothetical protein
VSTDLFRRRADECRHLAAAARDDSDKAFWLGLVERWQTLENQKAQRPARDKSRSPLRRQPELAAVDWSLVGAKEIAPKLRGPALL